MKISKLVSPNREYALSVTAAGYVRVRNSAGRSAQTLSTATVSVYSPARPLSGWPSAGAVGVVIVGAAGPNGVGAVTDLSPPHAATVPANASITKTIARRKA